MVSIWLMYESLLSVTDLAIETNIAIENQPFPPKSAICGGFHGHGGIPIARWFLLGKIPSING